MVIAATILVYFVALMAISRLTSRHADNNTFFRADRRSPWYMVAFGMVGASISGVTFVSVPGMVLTQDMTYLQTCLGFIPGYFAVAFILLPLYYRMNVTTVYTCLQRRVGQRAYKTGAAFFLLSKTTGAAVRFYVVCIILQRFVLDGYGVPFPVTVAVLATLIWLYTRSGGIKTLVWTDSLHTVCMFAALLLIIYYVADGLGMSLSEAARAVASDGRSRVFVWDDCLSRHNFWKQFVSGAFIVVVMTGLDQDMMQKNLTCKTLRSAQKDLCSYSFAFVPANLLFLSLGVLLAMLADRQGMALPAKGDELLPMFAATGSMGTAVLVLFALGIVASSFSSADSALTALTTCWCVDICGRPSDERLRRKAHIGLTVVFAAIILMVDALNSTSVIDAVYILCSYTYGPLLGLFAYALIVRKDATAGSRPCNSRGLSTFNSNRSTLSSTRGADVAAPYIAVAAPVVCLAVDKAAALAGYSFGYELLLLNGLLTFIGLCAASSLPRRP